MPHATERQTARTDWRHYLGAVLWSAFLAACLATMLFFAFVDPLWLLQDTSLPGWLMDRRSGYTLGFFFFWIITTLAAGLSAWLITTQRNGE